MHGLRPTIPTMQPPEEVPAQARKAQASVRLLLASGSVAGAVRFERRRNSMSVAANAKPRTRPAQADSATTAPSDAVHWMNTSSRVTGSGLSAPRKMPTTAPRITASPSSQRHIGSVSRSQVHALAKFLAGFEMRHVLAGKCDGVAGLGVAADSGRPEVKAEAAESANLYPVAAGQRCAHLLDDGSNRQIHVGLTEMLLLVGQLFDQLGLGHAITP